MKNILCKINRFFKNNCSIAVLDEAAGRWLVKPEPKNLPYLKAENANGRHILVKADQHIQAYYLLVDDLDTALLVRHHKLNPKTFKYGRMVVETSPGKYQVWIHSKNALELDEKRCRLNRLKSDPGADPHNRWERCPGFRNRKQKHRTSSGEYPLARLVWVDWKNKADIPEITLKLRKNENLSHQPWGGVCHKNKLTRSYYEKGDDSATDFAYALAFFRRGLTQTEIAHRIIAERQNWSNHSSPDYLAKLICLIVLHNPPDLS